MELNRCQLCDMFISLTKEGRAVHLKRFHAVTAQRLPYTAEEKARLVERGEQRLGKEHFIYPSDVPNVRIEVVPDLLHQDNCTCMTCFNKRLDILIAKQEAEINYVG
jgi:hypothetical protein